MSWSIQERIRQIKIDETIHVYEDNDILVVIPKTIHSMCIYGKGTVWCLASDAEEKMVLDGRMKSLGCQSTFDDYNDIDVVYIFIMKNEKDFMGRNKKFCMQFERGEFHDAKGSDKDFAKFIDRFPRLKQLLITHVKSGIYRDYPYPHIHLDYINNKRLMKKLFNPFDLKEFDI